MDLKIYFYYLFIINYVKISICYVSFNSTFENNNNSYLLTFKNKSYMKFLNTYTLKNKHSKFQLSLIFRKLKDQSMIRSIPSHVRRRNKKKKKKKKKSNEKGQEEGKKKVNKKLMRRRLLKFYKLKRKNEGKEENIFDSKIKYSVFDYIENKLSGHPVTTLAADYQMGSTTTPTTATTATTSISCAEGVDKRINLMDILNDREKQEQNAFEQKKDNDEMLNEVIAKEDVEDLSKSNKKIIEDNLNEYTKGIKEENSTPLTITKKQKKKEKRKKKREKKLKIKHIGKYHRKVYTYKKKVSVDDVHTYILNKQLKDKYILQKDTLKNVFVNKPLFNFYNFYNFFQIDHIEKYNKSKILNLIYYYIYKYKNSVKNEEETKYDYMQTDDIMKKYESIADDQKKMNHYLEYYINMNNNKYLYMNIDKGYTLKKKAMDAFTISSINKVDSLHIHNYKVVWTIRNVQEKLFWRFREMGNIPLTTSAFSFAGKKSFKLKIWLDGHKSARKNYVSVGLKQLENYGMLEEYICLSLNGITKGPFTYLSKEYYQNTYNFCKFDDLDLKNNELKFSLFVYDGII
ncbi:conserved Plasmodium protein, unknown function [Plasmodium malariae]|uniref:Uncharacterized protein n=1 Tax=Plasmodium malariae TaxID=5858 RepID=A0A1C3KBP7_PLAMA|nr:conserved Plasmodium protein, unknown function [Plasmodium malariae]